MTNDMLAVQRVTASLRQQATAAVCTAAFCAGTLFDISAVATHYGVLSLCSKQNPPMTHEVQLTVLLPSTSTRSDLIDELTQG